MFKKLFRLLSAIFYLFIHILFSFKREKILIKKQSKYNNLIIISSYGSKRIMHFNDLFSGAQSEIDLKNKNYPSAEYIQLMLISLIYYPFDLNNKNILIIGLGGGILPRAIRNIYPNCKIKIIEIDEIVYELAKKYFYFKEDNNLNIEICDGRYYLNNLSNKIYYDIILIDAYDSNNSLPFNMKTEEFFILLKNHLNINGSFIIFNLLSIYQSYLNISKTIYSVFKLNKIIKFRTNNLLNIIIIISTFKQNLFLININQNKFFIENFKNKLSINVIQLLKNKDKQLNHFNSSIQIYKDQNNQIFYENNLSFQQFINLV